VDPIQPNHPTGDPAALHPIGAILGDFVGSRFERHNIKVSTFAWTTPQCRLTDDSVLTVATCEALLADGDFRRVYRACVAKWAGVGFSKSFQNWSLGPDNVGTRKSSGCGPAIRVSPIGWAGRSLAEVLELAERSARSTHDHAEAVAGAQAVAGAVFLLRNGASIADACAHAEAMGISLKRNIASWRTASWSSETLATVPVAFAALREGHDAESVTRLAVSAGGDSDSIASMATAVSEACWGIPDELAEPARTALSRAPSLVATLRAFSERFETRSLTADGGAA
jgi:ADP-ribosyl-[dinitrogen reductase] hydrolase